MESNKSAVRLPSNHRIVLEIVQEQGRGRHATTSDIFSEAKRRKPTIGYSTVYRALDRLCAAGLVAEVRIPGTNSILYEPVGERHAHFVCGRCGQVDDIDDAPSLVAFKRLATSHDIEITGVSVTLHGLCSSCRKQGTADP